MVAAGAWCAAGVLTVASPDSASRRLAMAAPWWVFASALALALLVPAWRRRPLLATPALLSTLAWWPIPLPPIALIWTGPLAWLPVIASLACAWGSAPLSRLGRWIGADDARRSTVLAGLLTLLAGGATAWNVDARVPGGDEPHYLIITQSLIQDRDIQIENNHRQRDYAAYYGGNLAPDYVKRGINGEIYSIHAPGVSALVVPAFALAGYRGAEVFLLLVSALAGGMLWRIGWRLTDDSSAAWFAWAAAAGSTVFVLHSFMIYPDVPGTLIAAAAVLLIVRLERVPGNVGMIEVVAVSALLAALPWMQTRFAMLAAGLAGPIVLWLLLDPSRAFAARRLRAAGFLIVPALSAAVWFGFFKLVYGTFDPAVPYTGVGGGMRAALIPGGLVGLLFDQQFGLAMHAPVVMLACFGLAARAGSHVWRLPLAGLAMALVYLAGVAVYWHWWGGTPAGPGRLTMVSLPMFAVLLAEAWRRADADRRRIFLGVLMVSLAITAIVVGVNRGVLTSNNRDAQAAWLEWLAPVVNLPRGWPSFFWRLDPNRLSSEAAFAAHVGVWIAIFAGAWWLARWVGLRSAASLERRRVTVAAWLLGGLMVSTQAGWWLNGVSGLDAARSQSRVLAGSHPVVEVSAFRIQPRVELTNLLRIGNEEPGRLEGARPWLVVESLPAGTYSLRISTPRPRAGELLVTAGRRALRLRTIRVQPLSRQTETLVLPTGVAGLVITPADALGDVAGTIELEPLQVARGGPIARLAAQYGSIRTLFFDDNVFAEDSGFWVRGGQSASLAVEADPAAAGPLAVTLQNGRGENEIILDADGVVTRERFGPFETRRVELPASGAARRLTITSASGFRPSADGTSRDDRYLGVFVKID
jgi:hypothetical protein